MPDTILSMSLKASTLRPFGAGTFRLYYRVPMKGKPMATGPTENNSLSVESAVRQLPPTRYSSCRHIERGLAFWGDSVTACCGNTHTGAVPTIVAPFAGDITAEAIMEGRARIIRRHKA